MANIDISAQTAKDLSRKVMIIGCLIGDDGAGGEVGIDDNLDATGGGGAGTALQVVAGYFGGISIMGAGLGTPHIGVAHLVVVDGTERGAVIEGVVANETDSLGDVDLL